MGGRKRTVQIKFRVTEEEHRIIEQRMKLVPTRNMAAYMRKLALDGYIIQIDHTDIKKMTAEIQKIGDMTYIVHAVTKDGVKEDAATKIRRMIQNDLRRAKKPEN